jgi:hypothetical protein
MAAKESAVFDDKPVMVFAFRDMGLYKNSLIKFSLRESDALVRIQPSRFKTYT